MDPNPPELLKADEIADMYRISTATVHRWRRQGLPAIRVGRMIRFRRADVESFLAVQSQAARDEGETG